MIDDPRKDDIRIFPRFHTVRFLLCGVPGIFSVVAIAYAIKVYPDDYLGRENLNRSKDLMIDAAVVGFATMVGLIGAYVAVRLFRRRSGRSR